MPTHFKGFARTRWPMVTKLASWLDMKDANEETLKHKTHIRWLFRKPNDTSIFHQIQNYLPVNTCSLTPRIVGR